MTPAYLAKSAPADKNTNRTVICFPAGKVALPEYYCRILLLLTQDNSTGTIRAICCWANQSRYFILCLPKKDRAEAQKRWICHRLTPGLSPPKRNSQNIDSLSNADRIYQSWRSLKLGDTRQTNRRNCEQITATSTAPKLLTK